MAVPLRMESWPDFEAMVVNPQDAVVIRLLLEGVTAEEIAALKLRHIDAENRTLTLSKRKGTARQHPVSKICLRLLHQALQQTMYPAAMENGTEGLVKLDRSDYVIKVSLLDHVGHEALIRDLECVRLRTIYSRIRKLNQIISELGSPEVSHPSPDINLVS